MAILPIGYHITLISTSKTELAVSAGGACTTTTVEPSHVIIALGYSEERAYCSIRIGLGRHNTEDEVKYASGTIVSTVNKIKSAA